MGENGVIHSESGDLSFNIVICLCWKVSPESMHQDVRSDSIPQSLFGCVGDRGRCK